MPTTKRRKKRAVKKKRPTKRRSAKRKVGAVKRKPTKRKVAKRKPAKRKKRRSGRKVVRQVERRSVERVLTGKHKPRRRKKRRIVMAGTRRVRRRRVGGDGGGSMKWLLPVAIGVGALYLLSKKNSPASPGGVYQLPPLTTTQNQVRNSQSQDLVNYAVAGGLALDAILKLIDKLNTSDDQQVQNIYDVYHTTGSLDGVYV